MAAGTQVVGAAAATPHYYIDDHLGSTQMELSSGGWPVWSGQFTPFGQEIVSGQVLSAMLGNPQPGDGTTMHYKFTGKERDSESGLDCFGARYYASNVGRWISAARRSGCGALLRNCFKRGTLWASGRTVR